VFQNIRINKGGNYIFKFSNFFFSKNKIGQTSAGGVGGMEEGEEHVEIPVDPALADNGTPQSGPNIIKLFTSIIYKF
jgi:hypothetical protein